MVTRAAARRRAAPARAVQPRELDGELERQEVLLVEVQTGEGLDAVEALAERVGVDVERAGGRGERAAVAEVALERPQQLGAAAAS